MSREKRALQEHAKEIRCSLSREMIEHHSLLIERHLRSVIAGESPTLVYVSKANEVDTRRLIASLPASGTGVVIPIIERESRNIAPLLSFRSFCPRGEHLPGTEPQGCEIPARPG